MRANIPDDLAAAIARGGEMGGRLAELDWSSHPLGPPAGWPITTRAIVSIALASRFPTVLWLGEELFLVYNDAYLPVLGDKHPAALGRPGREVWWDIWGVIGPMLSGVMQSGVATWSDDLMLPVISSGRPEERYFTFTYSPIIATDGRVGGVYCVVAETTERVLGERRLQALSALGSALMETGTSAEVVRATLEVCAEHSADLPFLAVYLDDPDQDDSPLKGATPGVLEAATSSAAYLSSWGPTGPHLAPSIVGNLGALRPAPGAALRANRPEKALVIPLADSARAARVGAVVVGLNPLRPFDDAYRAFCRLVTDQISAALANATAHQAERQRANALAELDRAKTAFLANVSHEFRTPLTLMLGPIEEAIASVGPDTYVAESLATVERNGRRLLRMVNSLLDFSRLEGGETTAHLVVVDVGDLTAQLASSFAEMCRHAGIDLVLDCGSVRGAVDVEMWETVVLNLVSNAFKFTWEGSITVTVEAGDRGGVTVTFADTGSGIAKDDVPRLFDRFYRSADVAGRSVEGTGIGLSLVRSLVELHGGTIEIDSELGAGTNVTVRLPAPGAGIPDGDVPAPDRIRTTNAYVAEAAQWLPAPGPEARGSEPAGGGQPVVLIVDDNADMRRYLARILGGRWRTHVLGDGRSALDWARQNHPDLVVTDVMMPALDGFGLAAALRADPDLASIPLIMLSARAGPESAGEGMRAGVDDYVVKPFSSADLVRRVSARLEMSARERSGRQHAEQVAERASALAELGAAINSTRTLDELIGSLLVAHSASLAATAAAVAVLEPFGDAVRVRFTGALPSEFTDRYHRVALDAPMPIAEVVRTGVTMVIPDTLAMHERYEDFVADALPSVRAAVVEPLRTSDEQLAGALALLWPTSRQISTDDVDQARRVADLVARAVERIDVSDREHQAISRFQEVLQDLDIRSTKVVVGALYNAASETIRVGGDWYTATSVDDSGRLGVSVGDVAGHGIPAAATMSQLRFALGAAALTVSDPMEVLDSLDRYARTVPGAACATAAYVLVDADASSVSYACAGHPYPLLVRPDGTVGYLTGARRTPLCIRSLGGPAQSGVGDLPPGSALVLYTDGLVERAGESLDRGFDRLATAAADCRHLGAGDLCSTLLRRMAPPGGYTDDVVIVAVRPVGVTPRSFVTTLHATIDEAPAARHRLRAWLDAAAVDAGTASNVLLAAGEAVNNAMEHGCHLDPDRTVSIEAFANPGRIVVTVTDWGRWASDTSASRREPSGGRGLTLIHALSERVTTSRSSTGTRLTMEFRGTSSPDGVVG